MRKLKVGSNQYGDEMYRVWDEDEHVASFRNHQDAIVFADSDIQQSYKQLENRYNELLNQVGELQSAVNGVLVACAALGMGGHATERLHREFNEMRLLTEGEATTNTQTLEV